MDTVSVVIPVYNRAETIERCLGSVFNQTYPAIEVIVIDDGSNDDLAAVLAPVMSKIKFFRQENQGQGAARNAGANEANGRYLAFLDSDDWWMPEKLSEQMASIDNSGFVWGHMKTKVVTTQGGAVTNDNDYFGDWYRGRRSGMVAQDLLQTNFICTSSVLIEKTIFMESGGFGDERLLQNFEDYALWLRLAARYPIDYCETPAVCYFEREAVSTLDEVTEQCEKNDLVMSLISNSCGETYPSDVIEQRRYFFREHLFRTALRQGQRKVARHILQEMWHFDSFLGRNLLNTCLLFTPTPILNRN